MGAGQSSPGWFDLGRTPPFPAIYSEWKTPVTADVLEIGWVVAFFTLLLSFYCILPAANNRLVVFSRVTVFLLLGLVIMLCNFGQEWEVGKLHTRTQYRAGTVHEIEADIGVKLGLRSVNITLKGTPPQESDLKGERINYNERFTWAWAQGRAGFGPYAGQIQRDYRSAQFRGTPYPILWIAEYFTFDGEGIRFGRHYRTAGWYAHICIWSAFPMWIMTVILFKMVILYGAIALTLTGTLLVIASVIWAANRNFLELEIPFEDGILKTHFGIHWYLSLLSGVLCMVVGLILSVLADRYHNELHRIFGNNPLSILDEGVAEELPESTAPNEHEMERMDGQQEGESPRVVATFRGRGTSERKWKKSVVLRPFKKPSHLMVTPEEAAQVDPSQGHNYGTYSHPPQHTDASSSSGYPPTASAGPYHPQQGAYNPAYTGEYRYQGQDRPPQQMLRPNYVESAVYDDLPEGKEAEDEPLYENLPAPKKSPILPPKSKKY